MTNNDYFFDWNKVEAHGEAKNLTISVSGPCPAETPHGYCGATLNFTWCGQIMRKKPIFPQFEPLVQCPECKTVFSPPLLPENRPVPRWWYLAKAQEREEIRNCMREDERRGTRKAEKKGKKRKKKQANSHRIIDSSFEFESF